MAVKTARKRAGKYTEEDVAAFRADSLRHQEEFSAVWNQDFTKVARVLRAHLVVEHFLSTYLAAANPALGPIENARLSFAQKVELLGTSNSVLTMLTPGLKRLNQVRNRLAHRLSVEVSPEDLAAFLAIPLVRAIRAARSSRSKAPAKVNPLKVLEEFAEFTGAFLQRMTTDAKRLSEGKREPRNVA